jgi:hypothetical protein
MATIDEINKTIKQLEKARKELKYLAKKHIRLKESINRNKKKLN